MSLTPEQREKNREAQRRYRRRLKENPRPCNVDGCTLAAGASKGMCSMHYQRLLKRGDVGSVEPEQYRGPLIERFLARVHESEDGCWVWTGSINAAGYGNFGVGGKRSALAHRWSYEHHVGPIPDGMTLDHLCRVRACVNPQHLEPVTHQENVRRAVATRTTCGKGHPRTPEHGRSRPSDGVWVCKSCIDMRKAS